MNKIEIFGANRFETFTKTRTGSRAIIVRDGMILLTHETISGWWLVPGGGLEEGETPEVCCIREVEEETGYTVRPLHQYLTLYEYYEEYCYISNYFICEVTGNGKMHLTDAEARRGVEPQWLPFQEAVDIFSCHQSYADVNEEKRGSYLREFTALQEYMKMQSQNSEPAFTGPLRPYEKASIKEYDRNGSAIIMGKDIKPEDQKDRLRVRNAEKEDVRQIAEILVEDWQKAYRGIMEDAFLDSMNVDQRYEIEVKRYEKYIVAAAGNEILGYAWMETTEDESADCEVVAMYVRYSKRNNGIGKLLMQYAISHFREIGKKKMIVWCLKENDEARKFYEKVGGKTFRTGTHHWGGKEYEMISYLYDLG